MTIYRHVRPIDVLGCATPLQDHHAPLIITGICVVVWERIAHVMDVVADLSFMEVSCENIFLVDEMFRLDLPHIWANLAEVRI